MRLRLALYRQLSQCLLFQYCGTDIQDKFEFYTENAQSIEEATIANTSLAWSNICLQKSRQYMVKTVYDDIIDELLTDYFDDLSEKIIKQARQNGVPKEMDNLILDNISMILKIDQMGCLETDEFHSKLIQIYLSGHIPCKWVGLRKTGGILIF